MAEEAGLVVKIGADVSEVKAGLKEATESVQKFGKETDRASDKAEDSVKGMATAIIGRLAAVVAAVATVTAALSSLTESLKRVTAVGDLADSFRITVDQASRLADAAREAGIEVDKLTLISNNFGSALAKGVANPMSDISLALSAMGISTRNARGELVTFAEVLPQLADRFDTYADDAQRTQLAITLMGREGRNAAGSLRELADALTSTENRPGAINQEAVERARAYNAAVEKLTRSTNQLSEEFAVRLAPILTRVIDLITQLVALLPSAASGTGGIAGQIETLTKNIQDQEKAIAALEAAQTRLGTRARADLAAQIVLGNTRLEQLKQELEGLRIQQHATDWLNSNRNRGSTPTGDPGSGGIPAPNPDAMRRGYEEARFQLDLFVERLSGTRMLVDELNFTWMSHADIMEQVGRRVSAAYADQAEAKRRTTQIEIALEKQKQANMQSTAQLAAQVITQLFPKSKGAAIAAATINTAVGITKALSELLPPFNWIQAGLIAASGAAQIASIRSATPTGGGSAPSVSGGGASGGGEEVTQSRMLTISGLREEGRYGGGSVIGLIEQINEEVQNGAVLISTMSTRQQAA